MCDQRGHAAWLGQPRKVIAYHWHLALGDSIEVDKQSFWNSVRLFTTMCCFELCKKKNSSPCKPATEIWSTHVSRLKTSPIIHALFFYQFALTCGIRGNNEKTNIKQDRIYVPRTSNKLICLSRHACSLACNGVRTQNVFRLHVIEVLVSEFIFCR